MRIVQWTAVVACGPILLAACSSTRTEGTFYPGKPLARSGDEIVVCGQLFHTGAPVVLWTDPGGYDAYRTHCKFTPEQALPTRPAGSGSPNRYGTMRNHVPDDVRQRVQERSWRLSELQDWVHQFVIHYDVCGTSRRCFKVLHDIRGLSVHFMLDLDGTIYQTLDLKERAWHAGSANDRSVGIEIANIGAYTDMKTLAKWYDTDDSGRTYVTLPESMGDGGLRTPGFVARPARNEPVRGTINGKALVQYDFTDAQYESLIKLVATLCQVLPRIEPDYPRDTDGQLVTHVLDKDQRESFEGLLGHFHITKRKVDPGPAFDWDRVIKGARAYIPSDNIEAAQSAAAVPQSG